MKDVNSILMLVVALCLFSQTPDISLSTDSIYVIAAPESTTTDSFYISNYGNSNLNYHITYEYDGYAGIYLWVTKYHTNDFNQFPGTDYMNENWLSVNGGAQATGNKVTSVLTSPVFDTSDADSLLLKFDQNFEFQPGSYSKVEYNYGTGWTGVYFNDTDSNSVQQNIDLPIGPTGQLRFTGYTTKVSGNSASWFIDNIEVAETSVAYAPYTWLTLNVPDSGSVAPSDSAKIIFTCEAQSFQETIYHADITVSSNDPVKPEIIIPMDFEVGYIPEVPSNVRTSITEFDAYVIWDTVSDATSYDVYSSIDPSGPFIFLENITDNRYFLDMTENRKFYYVVSRRDPQ